MRRIVSCLVGLVGLVVVGAVVLVLWLPTTDTSALRDRLAAELSTASGYTITAQGKLNFEVLPHPGVSVEDIRVENSLLPGKNPLAQATRIEVDIALLQSLQQGEIVLGTVRLSGADVWFHRNEKGQINWTPAKTAPEAPRDTSGGFPLQLTPQDLVVQQFELHIKDDITHRSATLSSLRAKVERVEKGQPVHFDIQGDLDQDHLHLSGTVTPQVGKVTDPDPRWKTDLRLVIGDDAATLAVQGITGPLPKLTPVDLTVSLSSPEPSPLTHRLLGPEAGTWAKIVGPIDLKCSLHREKGGDLSLQNGVLELGRSGQFKATISGAIHRLLEGDGTELALELKSPDLSDSLKPLALGLANLGEARLTADLRGSVSALTAQGLALRIKPQDGLEARIHGDLNLAGGMLSGALDLSIEATDLDSFTEFVVGISPPETQELAAIFDAHRQRPLVGYLLKLHPVEFSARLVPSGKRWSVEGLKAKTGPSGNNWLELSGKLDTVWPHRDGVELKLSSQLEDPGKLPGLEKRPVAQISSFKGSAVFSQSAHLPAQIRDISLELSTHDDVNLGLSGNVLIGETSTNESGQMDFRLRAGSLSALGRLWGGKLPDLGPLTGTGQLNGTLKNLKLEDLALNMGAIKVRGGGDFADKTPTTEISLDLVVEGVDLSSLHFEMPNPGPEKRGSTTPENPKADTAHALQDALRPEHLQWLSTTRGLLKIRAPRVRVDDAWTIAPLIAQVRWADGVLKGPDITAQWPDGHLAVETTLDARQPGPTAYLQLAAKGLRLGTLAQWFNQPKLVTGHLESALDLSTRGESLDEWVENLNGRALVDVTQGALADRYADAVALSLKGRPHTGFVPMTCFIGAIAIDKGIVSTDALLWDAPTKQVRGMGVVNIPEKTLDLLLRPHLKDTIVTAVTVAVRIKGPLGNPDIRPEPLQTATDLARGLIGRTLGAVMKVSPQFSDAMLRLQSTTEKALSSTGIDVPIVANLLQEPVTCKSVSNRPKVEALRDFQPARDSSPADSEG
jgi:uncharacterized protein involved in outer membrane biogenesis